MSVGLTIAIPSEAEPRWKLPVRDGECDGCNAHDNLLILNADTANAVSLCPTCLDNLTTQLMALEIPT